MNCQSSFRHYRRRPVRPAVGHTNHHSSHHNVVMNTTTKVRSEKDNQQLDLPFRLFYLKLRGKGINQYIPLTETVICQRTCLLCCRSIFNWGDMNVLLDVLPETNKQKKTFTLHRNSKSGSIMWNRANNKLFNSNRIMGRKYGLLSKYNHH